MSGGVDSSVAAALLTEQGHDVIGVTMRLFPDPGKEHLGNGNSNYVDFDAVADAEKVAARLGIPHYTFDFSNTFSKRIIDDFCREYGRGRTPNPCIHCNSEIKFGVLLEKALEMGADFLATGHYARAERDNATGKFLLKKGIDPQKDQSYFLYRLTQEQLRKTVFPLGNYTKEHVREMAGKMGFELAEKQESREICFIPNDDYAAFLKVCIPGAAEPGPIVDESDKMLGRHRGIISYTIGQRKGLGIAAGEPLYVTAIQAERNTVVVGTREKTYGRELTAIDSNWISGVKPRSTSGIQAKIRYRHPEADAFIKTNNDGSIYVNFKESQPAITPGQAIVFYKGDTVLGGGTIDKRGSEICLQ